MTDILYLTSETFINSSNQEQIKSKYSEIQIRGIQYSNTLIKRFDMYNKLLNNENESKKKEYKKLN